MTNVGKTDNAKGAHAAKVQLRNNVLEYVAQARVFEAFSGLGAMFENVWHKATDYLGCDQRPWTPNEPHKRIVCDNRLAMRCLDLARFNVFDFDAYGCPWHQMLLLAHRRTWQPGERGAVILTDGSSLKTRWGAMSGAQAQLMGSTGQNLPRSAGTGDPLQRMLLQRWLKLAKVQTVKSWRATGRGSGRGGARMVYTALVFQGRV